MYFISPRLNKLLLSIALFFFSLTLFSQTADFKVQHIQDNVGRTGGTNTSFTAVSSLSNAIELANNNRKTHAGTSSNSGNLDGDDLSGARQLTNVNTLTYYRESGSNNKNMRFNTSIWEYVGPIGGGNELIVRGRYAITLNGSTKSVTETLTGITNAAKCIPFITGIMNDASWDNADSGTAIAYLENATTLRVQKGSDDNDVTVYITVVEFTGANWTVLHGDSGNTGSDSGTITLKDGSNGTGSTTNVSNWQDAIIFSHFRADNEDSGENEAISDLWPIVEPGSNNQTVDWTFNNNHDSEGFNRHFVHVLVNTGLNVTRFQNTSKTTGQTAIDITSAGLSDVNQALIVGASTSSGNGTNYARGWRNYYLLSTTEAAHWSHRSGNTMAHEIQIIDLGGLVTTYSGPEINIQGNGVNIPDGNTAISITDGTNFGGIETTLGSISQTFTIQNLGTENLTLDDLSSYIVITGGTADFTLTANPTASIAVLGSTTFTITYDPTTAGTHTATISILNNDSDENPYTFNIQGIGEYCDSNGSSDYDTSITFVSFNTINNADNEIPKINSYEDFTAISTNVYKNSTHNLTVNINSDGNWTIYTNVWIDWNRDGDFDDAGEEYKMGSATNVVDSPTSNSPLAITVPSTAVIGSTRMRVATKWASYPSSCESGFDGEVEDYSINIVDELIDFDGVDDYLNYGENHDLTGSFSLEAWVLQETTAAAAGTIMSKGNLETSTNSGYHLALNNNYPNLKWYNGSGTEVLNITSPYAISNNEWHHIAATYNGTIAKLYIDGIEVKTGNTSTAPVNTLQSFKIGAGTTNFSTSPSNLNFFNGAIQEIRIWDVALSEAQLREMMNQHIEQNVNDVKGVTIPLNISGGLTWNNLLGYYPLDSNTAYDSSSYNIEGTPNNITSSQSTTAPLPFETDNDNDWDTSSTWLNSTDLYIPNTIGVDGITSIDWNIVELTNDISSGDRDIKVLGLILETGKLTIADPNDAQDETNSGQELRVSKYLKLDGIIDLIGESQLIQTIGSDFDAASTGFLERDQQGEGNKYRYNDWSSPVYTNTDGIGKYTTISAALKDGTVPSTPGNITFVGGYNGSAGPPIQIASYWLYKYANLTGLYSEWDPIGSTGKLYAGEGFLMKGTGEPGASDQNYVFVGKPNNGTITLSVSGNNEYLVGNPYPSAIDTRQFLIDNSPSGTGSVGGGGAIYFWEHYGGDSHNLKDYQAGYATRNLTDGVPATSHASVSNLGVATKIPGQFIAVSQGFFVLADSDGGIIEFNNGQRIFKTEQELDMSGNPISVFMKSSNTKNKINNNKSEDTRPKFRIGFDAPSINHRQILLAFDENTSDAVDWGYDAEIYEIFEDDMYWMIDDKKYIIQATNTFSLDKEVPLGIQTAKDGNISIKVDALENVDETISIYIKDNLTGETYDIKEQTFEVNLEAGDYKNRFVLTFQPRLKTLEEVALVEGVSVYMSNDISELQLNRIVDTEIESIVLFNYLGQQVQTWNSGLNERFVSLPIKIATGVYIVRVHTTAGILTKKIIIN